MKIDCPIATFHSTGNAILRKQTDEKLNIVDNSKLYFVLQDYFHKQHGTTLIYTFSQYTDRKSLLEHLKEDLENQGFVLTPRSNKEVMEKLIASEENRYIRKLVKIVKTYRNSQEVIDIAGNFIQKNDSQITKELKSPKNIIDPVIIYTYDGTLKKANSDHKSGANYAIAHAVEVALEQIISNLIFHCKYPFYKCFCSASTIKDIYLGGARA